MKGFFNKLLKGDIVKKHDTGGLFIITKPKQELRRFLNKEISFTGPIFGKEMKKPLYEAAELEKSVLEANKINLEMFEKLNIKGTRRIGRVFPKKVFLKKLNNKLYIEFFLPKGSYATNFLREIMKN